MAGCALGGGLFFTALDALLNNFGAFMRKASTLSAPSTKAFLARMISGQTIKSLGRQPLFRNVPDHALRHLLGRMHKLSFERGQEICHTLDHESPFLYYIISGRVALDFVRADGSIKASERRTVLPENIFGHEALSVDGDVRVLAEAEQRTVLLRISSDDLVAALNSRAGQLLQEDPHDRFALQRMVRVFESIPADAVVGADPEDLCVNSALAALTPAQRSIIHGAMMQENFALGEIILTELDSMSPVYLVLAGTVSEEGTSGVAKTVGPGNIIGNKQLFKTGSSRVKRKIIEATSDCKLLSLRSQDARRLQTDPIMAEALREAARLITAASAAKQNAENGGTIEGSDRLVWINCEDEAAQPSAGAGKISPGQSPEEVRLDGIAQDAQGPSAPSEGDFSLNKGAGEITRAAARAECEEAEDSVGNGVHDASTGRMQAGGNQGGRRVHSQEMERGSKLFEQYRRPTMELILPEAFARRFSHDTRPPDWRRSLSSGGKDGGGSVTASVMDLESVLDESEMADVLKEMDASKERNMAIMIWLGILIDAIPESLVIGFIVAEGSRNPLVFVVGVFLSNFPEALASAATMRAVGMSRINIFLLWSFTWVVTGVGAMIGVLIIPETGLVGDFEVFVKGMEGLAAGAMLTMIAQTMLPEACHHGGGETGIACLIGFLVALLVSLIPL